MSWLGEREDVPELMRALDVLLLPSWEEPFGRALIEAMALGVPVLATERRRPGGDHRATGARAICCAPREPRALGARDRAAGRATRSCAPEMGRAGRAQGRAALHARRATWPRRWTSTGALVGGDGHRRDRRAGRVEA